MPSKKKVTIVVPVPVTLPFALYSPAGRFKVYAPFFIKVGRFYSCRLRFYVVGVSVTRREFHITQRRVPTRWGKFTAIARVEAVMMREVPY